MKFVVCSDLHLGAKKFGKVDKETDCDLGLRDTLNCFDAVIDFVIDNRVPLFFIAGDIYKNASPSALEHREFAKRIKRLSERDGQTYIVLGNHDIYYREGSYHAISYLQELQLPNIKIIDKPQVIELEDGLEGIVRFLLIPYQHQAKLEGKNVVEYYEQVVDLFYKKSKANSKKFCIGHQLVAGAQIGSWLASAGANEPIIPIKLFEKFNATILGHVHVPQMLNKEKQIVYCGAVDRLTFGDVAGERGFVYYSEGDLKLMKVPTRKFLDFKFKVNTSEDVNEMMRKIALEIKSDCAVKISIDTNEDCLKLIEVSKIIEIAKKAYYVFTPCPFLSIQRKKEARSEINEETNIVEALEKYVTKVIKVEDSKELIERGIQIIKEMEVQ